jgi:hypothetical protein
MGIKDFSISKHLCFGLYNQLLILQLTFLKIDVFVIDITQCHENIPIEGKESLISAVSFFVKNVFQQYHSQHPRSKYLL